MTRPLETRKFVTGAVKKTKEWMDKVLPTKGTRLPAQGAVDNRNLAEWLIDVTSGDCASRCNAGLEAHWSNSIEVLSASNLECAGEWPLCVRQEGASPFPSLERPGRLEYQRARLERRLSGPQPR